MAIEAQITALQAEAEAETEEVNFTLAREAWREKLHEQSNTNMARLRGDADHGRSRRKGKQ
jgi:hypothetical protein